MIEGRPDGRFACAGVRPGRGNGAPGLQGIDDGLVPGLLAPPAAVLRWPRPTRHVATASRYAPNVHFFRDCTPGGDHGQPFPLALTDSDFRCYNPRNLKP